MNSAIHSSTSKAPFEIIYGYLPRTFPPIVYDEDNSASMDFIENRMLASDMAFDRVRVRVFEFSIENFEFDRVRLQIIRIRSKNSNFIIDLSNFCDGYTIQSAAENYDLHVTFKLESAKISAA